MTNRMRRSALAYSERFGIAVFPCRPDKTPYTAHGFRDATTDRAAIEAYWEEYPDALIGIPTGVVSGIDVLDVDPRHGGNDSLELLVRKNGPVPGTVESITGGGGRHIFFRHEDGVRNTAGSLPGLDIRGEGGYIIAPPSIHGETGRLYAFELSSRLGEVEIAGWPEGYLEELQSDTQEPIPPTITDKIPDGARNDTLFRLACGMRRWGCQADEIMPSLMKMNERCEHPLLGSEVRSIAASTERYAPATPVTGVDGRPKSAEGKPSLPGVRRMSDVAAKEADWLWSLRIPRGRVTLLEGDPGEGKSFISLGMAASLSLGTGLPDSEDSDAL